MRGNLGTEDIFMTQGQHSKRADYIMKFECIKSMHGESYKLVV